MEKFFVGQPIPSYLPLPGGFSGGYLEVTSDGYYLILGLPEMDEKERETLRTEKMAVRVIEEDEMSLTLIRFGSTDLIFELPFDPTKYRDRRVEKLKGVVNTLQMIAIDTLPRTIQVLRFVSIPQQLLDKWYGNWDRAVGVQNFSERYTEWLNRLVSQYGIIQLWDRGVYVGRLGEI